MLVVIDFETHRIRPGNYFPRPVCLGFATEDNVEGVLLCSDTVFVSKMRLLLQYDTIIGVNLAWDLGLLQHHFPELKEDVFRAYEELRVEDIAINEKLILIGQGKLKEYGEHVSLSRLEAKYVHPRLLENRGEKKAEFNELEQEVIEKLNTLEGDAFKRYLINNKSIIKKLRSRNWRLRFKELENTPLDEWPQEPLDYVLADVRTPLIIQKIQNAKPEFLVDTRRQARYDFALKLITNHGVHTHEKSILEFEARAQEEFDIIFSRLLDNNLINSDHKRNTLAAKNNMLETRFGAGLPLLLTAKGAEVYGKKRITLEDIGKLSPSAFERKPLTKKDLSNPPEKWEGIFVLKTAALDQEACEEAGSELLSYYSRYQTLVEILDTRVGDLLNGVEQPIQTNFNVLVSTGRTSCSKRGGLTHGFQLQNPRREGNERSCFIARPGFLFCSVDYSGLELCTLAQVAYTIIGYSKLGEALNAGMDVHLLFACESLLGISYSEGLKRFHEPEIKHYRQIAKASNFSFPGGQGARSFRDKAYKDTQGKLNLTLEEAQTIRNKWFAQFHEVGLLLEYFKGLLRGPKGEQKGSFEQLFSGRIRGGCFFTQIANTSFQGLGADLCKDALYEVTKACYNDNSSILYGARPWNLLHDEILAEVHETKAHEQAFEMTNIMLSTAKKYLPNVRIHAEPALSKHWLKEAVAIFDENNRLIPYDIAKQAKTKAFYSDGQLVEWK